MTYTLDNVMEAVDAAAKECCTTVDDYRAAVKKHLTRPKFSEGQVVARTSPANHTIYFPWTKDEAYGNKGVNYRPLNQAEVGPDWVPREAAMKLREAIEAIEHYTHNSIVGDPRAINDIAKPALADFDEVVT